MTSYTPSPLMQISFAHLASAMGDDTLTTIAALVACRQMFHQEMLDGRKLITSPAKDIAGSVTEVVGVTRLQALLNAVAQPALSDLPKALEALGHQNAHVCLVLPNWLSREQALQLAHSVHADSCVQGAATACYQALVNLWPFNASSQTGDAKEPQSGGNHASAKTGPNTKPILLIAVDSLCERTVLARDHAQGLVHYPGKEVNGWIAGEAAAAVLLHPVKRARELQKGCLGVYRPNVVPRPANAPERWPSDLQGDGRVMQQAWEGALQACGMDMSNLSHLAGDFDGSTWRAQDRDAALVRLTDGIGWSGNRVEPANWLGQIGAAWGAFEWAMAAHLHRQGAEHINTVLSYAQETNGACAAAVLERSVN